MEEIQEKSCGIILYSYYNNEVRYLFLERARGWIDFPKGHVEKFENCIEAAKRETYEETGIMPEFIDPFFKHDMYYNVKRYNIDVLRVITLYIASVPYDSVVKISEEHVSYRWLSYEEACRELEFENQKSMLKYANDYINKKNLMNKLNYEYSRLPRKDHNWSMSRNYVPGEGNLNSEVIFIGQSPGFNEDETRRPFTGRAGLFLNSLLKMAGLERNRVYLTNVLKFMTYKNRPPNKHEIENAMPYLLKEIDIIRPKLIVLMGSTAVNAFLPKHSVTLYHGKLINDRMKFYITLHPASALHVLQNMPLIEEDFRNLGIIIKDMNISF
ncbi:uracil-DNA glycosylase family protein [Picrophilus oshimae]|uniref:Bis(5'-nucleosyl)-tetraphosphatase [asymmetrical] n=1 Tax=Picrophilus torridus (strain ATCC 700027 / DSM 9790 / JCM 10055 / NBRC 100828 / KAW 2/3) TaxID=1122961 RepID=A0A8G2FVD9_PICTO|nr:uracil-DNA glycosylase family protein [Picrophilus oshimae]SMD30187.1 DNA polymerase [Picrophilus oshimae DSM 9789]